MMIIIIIIMLFASSRSINDNLINMHVFAHYSKHYSKGQWRTQSIVENTNKEIKKHKNEKGRINVALFAYQHSGSHI